MKKILAFILSIAVLLTMATTVFASERTTFEIESKDYYDINEPIDITISTGAEYSKAEIWVDDAQIASYEGGSADIADAIILDEKVNTLGNVKLMAKVYYGDDVDVETHNIFITKLSESKNVFTEDFSSEAKLGSNGFWEKNVTVGSFAAYTDETGNKMLKCVLPSKIQYSEPFLGKDLSVQAGSLITIQFDVYFSTNTCSLCFETRDFSSSTYPANGGSTLPRVTLFTSSKKTIGNNDYYGETWYTCKYEMNTITKGLNIYIKEKDADEFVLEKSYPNFASIGLKQIRPCFISNSDDGGYILADNFMVDTISPVPNWYVKPSFENAEGSAVDVDNMPIEGGKINLAFSKAMEYSADSFKMVNEAGDVIGATASFDDVSFIGKLLPLKLRYSAKYSVVFDENLKSGDGYGPLRERKIDLATVKYPVNIESVTKTTGGVNVVVANPDLCTTEVVSVACYNSSGALTEFNTASVPVSGNLFVALSNSSTSDKIVVYVTDSVNSKIIYEVYEVK